MEKGNANTNEGDEQNNCSEYNHRMMKVLVREAWEHPKWYRDGMGQTLFLP
jgi:hypothetical protein